MSITQENSLAAGGMLDDFRKYLHEFKCEKGRPYTHTSMGTKTGGSYHVPLDRMPEFYQMYTRAMVKGQPLHLTEKPCDPSPMRTDLDFRFLMPKEGIQRAYTRANVETILDHYFRTLAEYVDAPPEHWVAYVMEKNTPTEYRGKMKDGIHIVWPHLVISHNLQHLVRKKILDEANAIFAGMSVCNQYEDVIDAAIIDRNNWQMYGSCKPDQQTYRVTGIYECDPATLVLTQRPLPSAIDEIKFVELLSMRHKEARVSALKDGCQAEIDEYIRHVLPAMDERRRNKLHTQIFCKFVNYQRNFINEDELNTARQLTLECLSPHRAENYDDWIRLGWTLRNIDYRLLDVWVKFSEFSSKYVEGECQALWDKMRVDTLGMGTLRWWARHDNPKRLDEIMNENIVELIDKCIATDGAHFDIAKVVYAMYKDEYRFTMNDTWFVFRKDRHRWVRTKEGLMLRMVLSNEVCSKFMERSTYWQGEGVRNMEDRERCGDRSTKLLAISLKLKQSGFKDSIMKECKCLFTDEKFEQLLDSHPHLIGFENGVYDLKIHMFRDGMPDDYISFSTGRFYIPHNPLSPEVEEINDYFKQVFTNADVRRFMKDVLAMILDGSIRQEKFYVFTGSGCHAKDTPVLMYDGSIKMIQDVAMGDLMMGDDSTPREVSWLWRGRNAMYKVTPARGDAFTVTCNHKLALQATAQSNPRIFMKRGKYCTKHIQEISCDDENGSVVAWTSRSFATRDEAEVYLKEQDSKALHENDIVHVTVENYIKYRMHGLFLSLYRTGVEYPARHVQMDPYMLGYWLGNGTADETSITTMFPEVVDYFNDNLPKDHKMVVYAEKGLAKTYGISFAGKRQGRYTCQNEIKNAMRSYGLMPEKFIPQDYLANSREVRMQLLAGFIDADATYQQSFKQYTLNQCVKHERVFDDVLTLARSLGFACYKSQGIAKCDGKEFPFFSMNITGDNMHEIPVRVPHKKATHEPRARSALRVSFQLEEAGEDFYYGVEVDKNHRYVMGDFTVTANSNSKSKLLDLVQRSLGDYYCILPIALLTQKRAASNAAQSELERTKGRRCAVMQEPGDNERLNIGLMKELSGGDLIQARGLFKEPIEFKPQFKMIMTCNELPEVPSDDGGTWRRIRVIEFTSKFVEHPDPNNPREFPLDCELSDKFERWSNTFASMLVDHHYHMDPKNIAEPMEVRIATEGYKKNNDVIGQYITDKIEEDPAATERLQLQKLFTEFKSWAYQVLPKGKKMPDRPQFRAYMEKKFGAYPSDGKGWKGIRRKVEEAEEEN